MQRLLLVDDHQDTLDLMTCVLNSNYEVKCCNNGGTAIKALDESGYDLMVTDIIMPDIEGIELILHCRKNYPSMKIIALTGKVSVDGQDYLETAMAFCAHSGMNKPISFLALEQKIIELLK